MPLYSNVKSFLSVYGLLPGNWTIDSEKILLR
jgi:hypothetical protein